MVNWFKKKNKTDSSVVGLRNREAKDPGDTVLQLRQAIQRQEKREEYIEYHMRMITKEAKKKMAEKNKKGAMFSLRKRKVVEAELEKIRNAKLVLESQVMKIESASQHTDIIMAMKSGTNAMKKVRQNLGINKVDNMMENIKEEMNVAAEINNAMSQPVSTLLYDEDELLDELNTFEKQGFEAELPKDSPDKAALNLPAVTTGKLTSLVNTTAEDEVELEKLEHELATI